MAGETFLPSLTPGVNFFMPQDMPTNNLPTYTFDQPSNGLGGFLAGSGLGMNLDTFKLGLGGLSAIGSLWNASQQNKLAKKQFDLQSGILNTNLANQIKSYNLGIDDKFRSRAVVEGTSAADRDAAIARWQATDQRKG